MKHFSNFMIYPTTCSLNTDLAVLVRTLHKESQGTDESAIRHLIGNIEYILRSHSARLSSYNGIEIATEIDMEQKKLPAVGRDTYRPHVYFHAAGIGVEKGRAPFSFVVPFPLVEEAKQYGVRLKVYPAEATRVPGLTINVGENIPLHIFFYAEEIQSIRLGHVVQNEYAQLVVQIKK